MPRVVLIGIIVAGIIGGMGILMWFSMQDTSEAESEEGNREDTTASDGLVANDEEVTVQEAPVLEDISNWTLVRYGSDLQFRRPEGWWSGETPPELYIMKTDRSIIISVERVSFENFGSTYCGGNYVDKIRCEAFTVDGVVGFIDWNPEEKQANALFGVNEGVGFWVSLDTASDVATEDNKRTFRTVLSTFDFGDISSRYLRLVAPNGGESLCLDKSFEIVWVHGGVKSIRLWLRESDGTAYDLGSFPADYNEENRIGSGLYAWRIGERLGLVFGLTEDGRPRTESGSFSIQAFDPDRLPPAFKNLPTGYGYKMGILDNENSNIYDVSDNQFSIIRCEE